MTEEYSCDYVQWLENTLFKILSNNKNTSSEKIIKKLETKGINCHEKFIEVLDKIAVRHKIVSKLPLLDTYPIDLLSDIYDEDIERINEWEIKIIAKLYEKLKEQCKGKIITPDIYYAFFNSEIILYKEYFLDETYKKILPENIIKYWCYRSDKTISWDENNRLNKIGIDIIAVVEGAYLKIQKSMYEYEHLLNDADC